MLYVTIHENEQLHNLNKSKQIKRQIVMHSQERSIYT